MNRGTRNPHIHGAGTTHNTNNWARKPEEKGDPQGVFGAHPFS